MTNTTLRILTNQDIEQLFTFVRKHYVDYFDVQVELVDHLANDIEQQWEADPTLSFDTALDVAFKKFGIFGFSDLVDTKKGKLANSYLKKMFKVFTTFFTLPRIIFTLACFLVTYYILLVFYDSLDFIFIGFVLIQLIIYFSFGLSWQQELKKVEKKTAKKWLITSVALRTFGGYAFLYLYQLGYVCYLFDKHVLLRIELTQLSYLRVACYAAFIIAYSLWTYITLFVYRPYMREEINYTLQQFKTT